jgi:hypothetical protein
MRKNSRIGSWCLEEGGAWFGYWRHMASLDWSCMVYKVLGGDGLGLIKSQSGRHGMRITMNKDDELLGYNGSF